MRCSAFLLSLLISLPILASPSTEPTEPVLGITVSTHTDGRDWASDAMGPTFEEIRELGSNWVAIHPYAGIRADGTVYTWGKDGPEAPAHIARPIREAHARGLKILIKPHLAYWGSPFSWRGEIRFEDDASWKRFWESYERWIVQLAEWSKEADGFVVGTELDQMLGYEKEWRGLIGKVRQKTSVPLTYAANWPDFERVGFWDALDVVGIQAYFPVADGEDASRAELERGWAGLMTRLASFADRVDRDILFTELGYNRSFQAAVKPWEYRSDGREAEAFQQTCLDVALKAIAAEPRVVGVFLWKWFPQPRSVGRNFQLATPALKKTIRDAWRQ